MPIIKSAIKRVRQEATRRKRNDGVKAHYKGLVKEFTELAKSDKKKATAMMPMVQKAIDMAVKKNQLHMRTAGRKKGQLMKMIAA